MLTGLNPMGLFLIVLHFIDTYSRNIKSCLKSKEMKSSGSKHFCLHNGFVKKPLTFKFKGLKLSWESKPIS